MVYVSQYSSSGSCGWTPTVNNTILWAATSLSARLVSGHNANTLNDTLHQRRNVDWHGG